MEKQLSAYISARYGKEHLGLFSALCSYESFRTAASQNQLSKLLGMNLLSFEKYLALKGVIISGEPNGRRRVLVNKRTRFEFTDDPASSITGLLVEKLRALYPEANNLVSQPLVQVVTGNNIDDLHTAARKFEYPASVHAEILASGDQQLIEAAERYDTYSRATGEELIDKFNLVESWHKLLVLLRTRESEVEDEMLPFNTEDQYEAAIDGHLDCSLKWYKPRGRIPDRVLEEFETFFEPPEYRMELSDDRKEYKVYKVGTSLGGKLKLSPAPAWVETLSSESLFDDEDLPEGNTIEEPTEDDNSNRMPSEAGNSGPNTKVETTGPPEGTIEGVDHVVQWFDQDVSKLRPDQLEICWYGFPGGKKYLDGVSKAAQTRVFRAVKTGKHRDIEVIYEMSRLLKNIVNKTDPEGKPLPPLTPEQLGKLTGGVIVKRKSNFKLYDNGMWERLPSPGDF